MVLHCFAGMGVYLLVVFWIGGTLSRVKVVLGYCQKGFLCKLLLIHFDPVSCFGIYEMGSICYRSGVSAYGCLPSYVSSRVLFLRFLTMRLCV